MSEANTRTQPKAQAGWTREAPKVAGEVGVLHRSVDLWESITHGEPREGTYPNAERRSEGRGDGSQELTTPNKVRKLQITLYRKAKAEPKCRFWSLYGEVSRQDVLEAAFGMVAKNDGAPGVDGESLENIVMTAESKQHWLEKLRAELKAKCYRPAPVRRVFIGKRSGGKRPLGIPTVRDRVVQAAVYLVLMPILEAGFHDRSHGFRPKRSAHEAMEAISPSVLSGRHEVLDADISKYFDTIPHRALMKEVAKRVSDGSILALIKGWLRAPVVEEKAGKRKVMPKARGTPQGGVISPLLANIYLNPLDHEINESKGNSVRMERYADDFVVLCPKGKGQQVGEQITAWMEARGLTLHEEKTRLVDLRQEGIRFLGFTVSGRASRSGRHYPHIEPAADSCAALRGKLRDILNPSTQGRSIEHVGQDVNAVVRGWSAYFHYGNSVRVFAKMQSGMDNRLRRWVWRKHPCRRSLHSHYDNEMLHEQYGLWSLPRTAGWRKA